MWSLFRRVFLLFFFLSAALGGQKVSVPIPLPPGVGGGGGLGGVVDVQSMGFSETGARLAQWEVSRPHPVVVALFEKHAGSASGSLSVEKLQLAWSEKTGDSLSKDDIERMMGQKSSISLADFQLLFAGRDNSAFSPAARKPFHDMSQPLQKYFIASSHNTYLMKDQ